MILKTKRMILRQWNITDADMLYKYASDPRVGPIAGWPAHTSIEESRTIIKNVLSSDEIYALVLKGDQYPIGSIGLKFYEKGGRELGKSGGEIGYWMAVPYWGNGLMPEAVNGLLRHGFEDLGLDTIWCGYYDGNNNSKRVQIKCGFDYHHTERNVKCPLVHDIRTEHITCITIEKWKSINNKN